MKKILFFIAALSVLISISVICVSAENEYELSTLEDEVREGLFSAMEDDVVKALDEIGITDFDFASVYKLSLGEVLSYFTPEIKEKAQGVMKSFIRLFLALTLFMVLSTLPVGENEKTFSILLTALVAVLILPSLHGIIAPAVSVIKISNAFIVSYIPVLTLILSFSGNGMSATLFNTSVVGICEVMSFLISGALVDMVGCFICVVTAFSMNDSLKASRIIASATRLFNLLITSSGALLSGVLTVKNVMAVSVDSMSVRGIRFILSSFVPVIGSSISEAYSSVLGSINLIKGSVVLIGILAVVIINVPVIAEMLLYYLSFSVLAYFSEISCSESTANIFRMSAAVTRIFLALIIFQMFILIISTGLVLTIRNG